MSELQSAPDLRQLDEQYEVIGELRGTATMRYFIGRRRSDGEDVLIAVVDAATGGDNNALAHFASDAQILANVEHPNIARVLEGRWLGTDRFAVVTERPRGSTLHELLSADGPVANPRIATVLQEVNSALEWARDHGVVHRGVSPESLYIEPESGRVRLPLGLTPIPLESLPDACSDGRTIGMLAWSMLAGQPYTADSVHLDELRPGLARRVVDETTAMMACRNGTEAPDVERFLSVVAMGDVLREGEIEIARMQAAMIEERRVERARLEAEARASADRAAALEERLAKERRVFEQRVREEERRIASDQQQIAAERAQIEQERLEFADRVAEFELRAEIERTAVPSPTIPAFIMSTLEDDKLLHGGGRFGWMIPVATVGLLVLLIVFGSLIARHEPGVPGAVTIGNTRVVPSAPGTQPAILPRGGFLTQSAGSIGSRAGRARTTDSAGGRIVDSLGRLDSLARRDTARKSDTLRKADTLMRPDTALRRDSVPTGDTSLRVPPDTGRR